MIQNDTLAEALRQSGDGVLFDEGLQSLVARLGTQYHTTSAQVADSIIGVKCKNGQERFDVKLPQPRSAQAKMKPKMEQPTTNQNWVSASKTCRARLYL